MPKCHSFNAAMDPPKGPRAPWPPKDYRTFHKVKTGQSWNSVALTYLVPDVWDLIYFNFETENPREVNWYMHEYLGCEKSNDGRNFSFTDAEPGFLYIPPYGWKRAAPEDQSLATVVANVLEQCVPNYPYVTYKHVHVNRTDLLAVIDAIRNGRIAVKHDPALSGYVGFYESGKNLLTLKRTGFSSLYNRATVVHEATHAIMDMKRVKLGQHWENELIARAVDAQFTYSVDIYYADRKARDPSTSYVDRISYILGHYTNTNGQMLKRLEDFNKEMPSFIDGTMINPIEKLEWAIKHSSKEWWNSYKGSGI